MFEQKEALVLPLLNIDQNDREEAVQQSHERLDRTPSILLSETT